MFATVDQLAPKILQFEHLAYSSISSLSLRRALYSLLIGNSSRTPPILPLCTRSHTSTEIWVSSILFGWCHSWRIFGGSHAWLVYSRKCSREYRFGVKPSELWTRQSWSMFNRCDALCYACPSWSQSSGCHAVRFTNWGNRRCWWCCCIQDKSFHPHDALCLHHAFTVPKLLNTLQTAPRFTSSSRLSDLDSIKCSTLSRITDVHLDKHCWAQGSLPVQFGGLLLSCWLLLHFKLQLPAPLG